MSKENNLPDHSTLADSDKVRALKSGVSGNVSIEILKAIIAAGEKLVNGYYYYQDAANPVANDWRVDAHDTIYMKFERYSGSVWVEQCSMGGSAETDGKLIIRKDGVADLVIRDGVSIRHIARAANFSDGVVIGDIDGNLYLNTGDKILQSRRIESESWKVVQSDDTQDSTGISFYVDNTTLPGDGFISSKIKIKSDSIPAGIRSQLKIFLQSDLVNPIWLNVTDKELENGAGALVDQGTGEIILNPRFGGVGDTDVRLVANFSEAIILKGSTTVL